MKGWNFKTADEIILSTLRAEVARLLSECTDRQRAFFGKLYPEGLDSMSEHKLKNALDQCQRTILKNEKAATECPEEEPEP